MSRPIVLASLVALVLGAAACKKKPAQPAQKQAQQAAGKPGARKQAPPPPGALPADKGYAAGKIQAAVMEVETTLDVPGLAKAAGDAVKEAQRRSVETQTLTMAAQRGKAVFTTDDLYIPRGTQVRYNPQHLKYVLADPDKKKYWALSGSELANLLEGGPELRRANYHIELHDVEDPQTELAGYKVRRSDAKLTFDWEVKTRGGMKTGRVNVELAIWHSEDDKLKEEWGRMLVDFLTVPFQDEQGMQVVEQLKNHVRFPLKWSMRVLNERQGRDKDDLDMKLVTVTKKLEVKEIDRSALASPPPGFSPADGPYEFGEGGQTASEELLSKLPAKKGKPPQRVEPPE
jgi:hypothetical protein